MLDLIGACATGEGLLEAIRNNVLVIDNNMTDRVKFIVRIVRAFESK